MHIPIGIDSMSFYIPKQRISIEKILLHRKKELEKFFETLSVAQKTTGQKFLRLTQSWQDSVCMAAQATFSLIAESKICIDKIRYLLSATETPVDAAKPLSAYVLGLLQQNNSKLNSHIINYQIQHACAAGTIGIIQSVSLIQSSERDEQAIVMMSDIAHYETQTSAEITQGAGAISVAISRNPRLLELDIKNIGYASSDVDDFFRPLSSITARVKGRYSMQCYIEATHKSLEDYADKKSQSVMNLIEENDFIVFHTPFPSMPEIALKHLLQKKYKQDIDTIEKIMKEKRVRMAAEIVENIGNTYTAGTYFPLAHLLQEEYKKDPHGIIGKKILILSYGAGNTAVVFQAVVAKEAAQVIGSWNLTRELEAYTDISIEEYLEWCKGQETGTEFIDEKNQVFLKEIREDQYRIYGIS